MNNSDIFRIWIGKRSKSLITGSNHRILTKHLNSLDGEGLEKYCENLKMFLREFIVEVDFLKQQTISNRGKK